MPRDDILSKIHPRYHAQIEEERRRRRPLAILAQPAEQVEAKPSERRVRQSRQTLNKLEEAYQDYLRVQFQVQPGGRERVLAQKIRVWLSNGDWYKPDFFIPEHGLFIEVKGGHAFRGGFEFLKMAATQHPWAKFRLVWRERGKWLWQDILPDITRGGA